MSAVAPTLPAGRQTPFSDPRFGKLWISNGLFFSGFWAQTVVLGWLAFELTDSEFAVAAFTSARFAPLLVGPLGGLLADRTNRPRSLALSIAFAGAGGVVLAVLATTGQITYWQVVVGGLAIGMMQAPLQPVRFTLIMDIVGRELLTSANALNMAAMFGSRIIAPAIAAFLIDRAGVDWALWFSAAWYVPAWLLISRFPEVERKFPPPTTNIVADFVEGFRAAVRHRAMASVLLASIAANSFAWPILQGFLPVFAEEVFKVGAAGLGVLVAANGLGSLLGALVLAFLGDIPRKGRLFLAATVTMGLLLTAFATTGQMSVAIVVIFILGFSSAGFGVMQSTLMMLLAPEHARGRVMGVLMLSIGVMPIALLALGGVAAAVGVVATTIAAGLLLALTIALLAVLAPGLWRLQ